MLTEPLAPFAFEEDRCAAADSIPTLRVEECIAGNRDLPVEYRVRSVRHIAELAAGPDGAEEREGLRRALFVEDPAVRKAVREALASLGDIDASSATAIPGPDELEAAANPMLEAADAWLDGVSPSLCRLLAPEPDAAPRVECRCVYYLSGPCPIAVFAFRGGVPTLERSAVLPYWQAGSVAESMWNDRQTACREAVEAAKRGSLTPPPLEWCLDSVLMPIPMEDQLRLIGAAVRAVAGPEHEAAAAELLSIAVTEDPQLRPAVLNALKMSGVLRTEVVVLVPTASEAEARITGLLHGRIAEDDQWPSADSCDLSTESPEGPLHFSCPGNQCVDGPGCVSAEFTIGPNGWKLDAVEVYHTG